MATFKAVKNKAQSVSAMSRSLDYISQKKKTLWKDHQLVTGWNCVAQSAYDEMMTTKQRFQKTDGRQFYQFVQSFSPEERVTPEEVHAIGLELAQRLFPEFEVLVATHVDTEHPHSHLIVNSVSFVDGRKLHQNAADLQRQRQVSDEICIAHGLSVLEQPKRYAEKKEMSSGEYRSAAKGESWKFRLMNTIDLCMRRAKTRKEFIREMERRGYRARWDSGRKHITYTTPEEKKCRDVRLHDDKYLKEVMEREFRIREEIVYGRAAGVERRAGDIRPAAGPTHPAGADPVRGPRVDGPAGAEDVRAGAMHPRADKAAAGNAGQPSGPRTDGRAGQRSENAADADRTGWEAEREAAFLGKGPETALEDRPGGMPVRPGGAGGIAGSVVQLGCALEMGGSAVTVRDATTVPRRHGDSRLRTREQEKKVALGHKEDDHEEQQQQMY